MADRRPTPTSLPTHGFAKQPDGLKHIVCWEAAYEGRDESYCGLVLTGGFNAAFPSIPVCPACNDKWEIAKTSSPP